MELNTETTNTVTNATHTTDDNIFNQELPIATQTQSQSAGLSERHLTMHREGRTLVDDSNVSEGNLKTVVPEIILYARAMAATTGGVMTYYTKLSMAHLTRKMIDPDFIIPDQASPEFVTCIQDDPNSKFFIKPDAGIILWNYQNKQYPIFIGEDKVQGTNDSLHAAGKKRQATGNAIERYFKNVRAEEMLCTHSPCFPSIVFASGCDFHSSETIAKRLEVGNYGSPNLAVELTPEQPTTSQETLEHITDLVDVSKKYISPFLQHASIPQVCIKTHKWDEMNHGASLWTPEEYLHLSKRVIYLAMHSIVREQGFN